MTGTLVDSNVLLDIATQDPVWFSWSLQQLAASQSSGPFYINAIIFAEVSVNFARIEDLESVLPPDRYRRAEIPDEASFLAGKAYLRYKRAGGPRTSTLPDFFIGAHAAVTGLQLLTRDPKRYRRYFPSVSLISPEGY